MSDPLGILGQQQPDPDDPLGLLKPAGDTIAGKPPTDTSGAVAAGSGPTPASGRAATGLSPDHPAAQPGIFDRFVRQPINRAVSAADRWRDAFAPDPNSIGQVAQPITNTTVTEQAAAAKAQGARLIDSAAAADVSGTPGAQIIPASGGRPAPDQTPGVLGLAHIPKPQGPGQTAAAMDASQTMQQIETLAQQRGQFSPQKWMDIARRGMELGSALHAQGKHDEAEDVLRKAYNAQLLATGAKQADTPAAIALSSLLGIVKDPFAQQRKNLAELEANPSLTFTPEEQRSMLGRNLPAATSRNFDVTKDVAAPLLGMAPTFELGGLAGRGLLGVTGAAAERAGAEGIGQMLGRAARFGAEGAEAAGPAIPMRTAGLARSRIEEEVSTLRQQLPNMLTRGATQGQVVGAIINYRTARQQGASPEEAVQSAIMGAGLQVPMGMVAELGLGLAGRVAGIGYDPIGRVLHDVRDRFGSTPRDATMTAAEPPAMPAVDAARAREGKLPASDMMPGLHRDIAQSLDALLTERRADVQRNYEDLFAAPRPEETPAGPEFWQNIPPEDLPRAEAGPQPLGPEEPRESLIERPTVLGRPPEAPTPIPSALEAAMRRAGMEPAISPSDEANAHYRMQRAQLDAEEHARIAREEAQRALDDPNLRLEMAAQAQPGEKQGPLNLAQTIATAKDAADRGEPMAVEYRNAIDNYVDAAATVRDLPAGTPPSTRQQIALARAKAALDAARTKYGKQIGASAVLALAANNSDLDDEEKKWVGLGGLALLGTDVVKLDENHPLMERVPFYSRLRSAVDALPKKWDNPLPAADWIGKLKGTTTFKKEELALLLPSLEEAQRNKVKLSRDDVRAMAEEKLPKVERVNLAEASRAYEPNTDNEGEANPDPDNFTPVEDITDAWHPDAITHEIENRQARIDELEAKIEDETNDVQREMDAADENLRAAREALDSTADEYGLSGRVFDDAFDYLHEHVEAEYIPQNAVKRALEKIQDDLLDVSSDPETLLDDHGYKVKEEESQTYRVTIEENGERVGSEWTLDPGEDENDLRRKLAEEYGEEAASKAEIEDAGTSTEYVVLDPGGEERARDEDRDDAMQEAIERDSLGDDKRDQLFDEVHAGLETYAERLSEYNRVEGEHHYATEGERFDEEKSEIDTLRDQIHEIESIRDDAVQRIADEREGQRAQAAADAGVRALETGGQQTLFPREGESAAAEAPADEAATAEPPKPEDLPEEKIIPEVHGKPKYASYQRVPGGRNYREMLNIWSNNPGDPYEANHYGNQGYANSIGHVRAEDHTVPYVPGLTGEKVEFTGQETEAQRIAKSHVVEVRGKRDKLLDQMAAIVAEHARLPEEQQQGAQAQEMARRYGALNQQVIDLGKREDELIDRAASLYPPGELDRGSKNVAVMIESQSDWAQDAGKHGVAVPQEPPTMEQIGAAQEKRERAQRAFDEARAQLSEKAHHLTDAEQPVYNRLFGGAREPEEMPVLPDIYLGPDVPGMPRPEPGQGNSSADIRWRFTQAALADPEMQAAFERSGVPPRIPEPAEILNPGWQREWALLRKVAPDLAPDLDRIEMARRAFEEASKAAYEADRAMLIAIDEQAALTPAARENQVPPTPFVTGGTKFDGDRWNAEGKAAYTLNAARFLLDAAERGHADIAWSDAANRVKNAHLPMQAAKYVYDDLTPSAMKSLLGVLGFRDVKIDKLYIKGEGHWHIELTRQMREAIKRTGLPILGVAGLMALTPSESQAQGPGAGASPDALYHTALGGIAAGAALIAFARDRKVRRLVKENRDLERALMVDDLSGLANKKAFLRARDGVDNDPTYHWVVFDGDRFKKLNDVHGHAEGDKAIQHFGRTVMQAADDLKIPMRGFRFGGDEIAFAAPAEHAAEFLRAVEERSAYTKGDVTTKLTGGTGKTFEEADALLNARKEANRAADPTLRRPERAEGVKPGTSEGGAVLYANPIAPAMRELLRYPAAASVAAVGALATQSDDPDIQATGKPLLALAALSTIGSRRIAATKDFLADKLLTAMQKSEEGTTLARFFNPDALLHPDVRQAILDYEATRAKGQARAAEFSGKAKELGPQGDRAVSDIIENEAWEDVSAMSPKDMTAALTVAAALQAEYSHLAAEKVSSGVIDPLQLLPDYAGPRRYAFHEAADVLAERRQAGGGGKATRIGPQKSRTLDEPIRDAQRALTIARTSGDPAAIQAAQDKLDEARAVQLSQRVERGEIREASYRAAQGIEKGYADVAAAKLFQQLRAQPGVAHPEWVSAVDDLTAAKQMRARATTPADRQAADDLIRDAKVKIDEITRRFRQKDGDYVSLPDTPGLGALRGAVVQRDVANSLVGFGSKGLYGKLLRAWKNVKTIFNPGTHAANIISNITFAHMEGLPLWEQPIYLKRAAQDMRKYGPMTRALAEAGILGHNAVNAEGAGAVGRHMKSEEGLTELLGTTRPETADVLRRQGITEDRAAKAARRRTVKYVAGGAALGAAKMYDDEDAGESAAIGAALGAGGGYLASRFGRAITQAYGSEDDIFRIAIGLKKLDQKLPMDAAVTEAKHALGNFRTRSPALQVLRSSVAPFILYPAKVLPRFAAQVVDHPVRWMTLMALWGGLNEYSQQQVGDVPDIDVPPGQRRLFGYFMPGFTQLPMRDERGNRAATDIGRWTPISGITSGAPPGSIPAAFDEHTPDVFRAGGPVVDLAAKFGANIDPFTQKPVYRADYPARENIGKLLNDVSGTMLPSALDFHAARIKEDIQNRDIPKLKNDALGPSGLRPRFIRPGGNARAATFELQQSLNDMKQSLKNDLIANKNPARVPLLRERYLSRVRQAIANYRSRLGVAPPTAIVQDALGAGRDATP